MLSILRKNLRKMFLFAVSVAVLAGAITVAYARNTCIIKEEGGWVFYVSCGSSAGNFLYRCNGDECVICDTSICDEDANRRCQTCDALGD